MKKVFFTLCALLMCISASAFEFDGIDLNANIISLTRNISLRGYVTDPENPQTLKGNCQGKEIYMTFDFDNVNQKGKLGKLTVDVPMKEANAFKVVTETFNVTYHQIDPINGKTTYLVDNDGTTLSIEKTTMGIRYTYLTPYYKSDK